MGRRGAVLAVLLMVGCGSSPKTNFFALSVVGEPAGTLAAVPFPVQVVAVHLPPALDRRQMVRMAGENGVDISETDRWSADLGEMVRNVLSQDLAARLPPGRVILPDAPPPQATQALVVTVAQFGPDARGDVKLNGSWALVTGDSTAPALTRDFRFDAGHAPAADATAAAMSRALGRLADAIASVLATSRISTAGPSR